MGKNQVSGELVDRATLKELKDLIQLFKKQGVSEFRLEQEEKGVKLHVVMTRQDQNPQMLSVTPVVQMPAQSAPAPEALSVPVSTPAPEIRESAAGADNEAPATEESTTKEEHLLVIKSPMVGTFYRAPAPDADPYVEVDTEVEEETVLCIVEAMKLMNEIKSEIRGKIAEICAQNGQPVEYGQALFKIQPA